jgi:predicted RNA-binding Zn ribbon-like protein
MRHAWTDLQFVGGTVALDFANTVCYRQDPARRFDKISDAVDLLAFARAARSFSDAGRFGAAELTAPQSSIALALCRELREAADALFRPIAIGKTAESAAFATLLRLCAPLLPGHRIVVGEDGIEIVGGSHTSFALVLLHSALRLVYSPELSRLKACPNCNWLFIDRSKNGSRVWCDMLTCGNRAKAHRHQQRSRSTRPRRTGKKRIGG